MNTTARRAAHRLARTTAPIVLRTWHGVELTEGLYGGLRGWLIGTCPDNPRLLRLKRTGADVILCCIPPSRLTGSRTLHGGKPCPGNDCTEGAAIDLEVTA